MVFSDSASPLSPLSSLQSHPRSPGEGREGGGLSPQSGGAGGGPEEAGGGLEEALPLTSGIGLSPQSGGVGGGLEEASPLRLRRSEGRLYVFDPLRRRYVALTPEERVRQLCVAHLVNHLGYDAALMANEVQITLHHLSRRCDTVVYDSHLRPRMIIEYKRPSVPITQKVFAQICRYNSVLRVPFLLVCNGRQLFCCRIDYARHSHTFLPAIPSWEELMASQTPASPD